MSVDKSCISLQMVLCNTISIQLCRSKQNAVKVRLSLISWQIHYFDDLTKNLTLFLKTIKYQYHQKVLVWEGQL